MASEMYVDTIAAAGLHYHAPVRVQTTGNLNATYLVKTFENIILNNQNKNITIR